MTPEAWLDAAGADARRRGLPELEALLKGLCAATIKLRAARFADDASGASSASSASSTSSTTSDPGQQASRPGGDRA
jgi:hypothetical protein